MNIQLKILAELAKIDKNLSTHVARRSFGTHLGTMGVSPFILCKLMGHTDVGMTQQYVLPSNQSLDEAMKNIWEMKKNA